MASKKSSSKRNKRQRGQGRSGRRSESPRQTEASRPQTSQPPGAIFPVISGHAGLTPMDRDERSAFLDQFDADSALQTLVSIQSRIDVATTSDWSEGRVERQLLTEAGPAWVSS